MTKTNALFNFWMSFGMPAYNEQSVPSGRDKPDYPYISYQVGTGDISGDVMLTASIWDRNAENYSADIFLDDKVQAISDYIGYGGKIIPCDGGAMWIKRGSVFSQNMSDPSDDMIRRRLITITVNFLTPN